jgi:hypothetical protein
VEVIKLAKDGVQKLGLLSRYNDWLRARRSGVRFPARSGNCSL